MRVTKVMLEEQNEFLRGNIANLTRENFYLKDQVKLLNGVIATYSRMPSLIIATERISDALAHTVGKVFQLHNK